jgi:glycosyltransferase involved in cell wall biosynthesis
MATNSVADWRPGSVSDRSLKVLQVSTYDLAGGAEKISWSLHQGYKSLGIRSLLAVGSKRTDEVDVFQIPNAECMRWLAKKLSAAGKAIVDQSKSAFLSRLGGWISVIGQPKRYMGLYRGIEDFDYPATWNLLGLVGEKPDIVHCHNLHGCYFDLRSLPWLSQQVRVVLTLHDAWLLTGHCAHSFNCERWKTGCGKCPDLTIPPAIRRDSTASNWRMKREIYSNSKLYLATPSQWLMDKLRESILWPAAIESRVIPNGVDLTVFRPGDQAQARAELGIPLRSIVVLFASNGIRKNFWKDFRTMHSAISIVAERNCTDKVIFMALGEDAPTEHVGRTQIRFVPSVRDPRIVARYFQAADVYIHAVRAETFGLTITEAFACGAPVVATAVGGIPELVEHGLTGFLVPPGDAEQMAEFILALLTNSDLRRRMGERAAQIAQERYGLNTMVRRYLDWYGEILDRKVRSTPCS